jgi:hypothetical protein
MKVLISLTSHNLGKIPRNFSDTFLEKFLGDIPTYPMKNSLETDSPKNLLIKILRFFYTIEFFLGSSFFRPSYLLVGTKTLRLKVRIKRIYLFEPKKEPTSKHREENNNRDVTQA